MSSSVFYKFRNQKETSRIEFEGTGISVFELKRDIIIKSGLGDGTDFDLTISTDDSNSEVYDDDTAIIPRSTTVVARRLPSQKKGAGRAQRYVNGKMPANAKNNSRKEVSKAAAKATAATGLAQMDNASMTEEERLQAMFQAQNEQWNEQLHEMSKQAKVPHSGFHKKSSGDEPPSSYVCYRCGQKGHWIKECPTNNDPNWNPVRLKRTTGIPRSFLKTVEKPEILNGDGSEDAKLPPGVMVNAEGQFVIAEPDKASWEKFQAKTKSSAAAAQAAALGDKELQDRGLECSIDNRIFIDPMKTPCCEKTYCNDCITNALIDSDFTCPGCQTEGVLIDDLKTDDETSAKITAYLEEKNAALRKEKERSRTPPSVKPETPTSTEKVEKANSPSPAPKSPAQVKEAAKSAAKSPSTAVSTPNPTKSPVKDEAKPQPKKRPAEELLENPKIPKAPKAMQQQEAQKQAMLQQQQMMNGMAGFPNMPFMPNMPNMPNMMNNFNPNGGFAGMPNMMNGFGMGMPNPMIGMNPMMGMNNFGGFPNMYGGAGFNGMGNMGMMNGNMGGQHNANGIANGNGNLNGAGATQFPNQQKTVFAEPLPNEEDNAYFRKPVNPHRHQGRQRRVRPSDYREL
ncbi:DWNN-domain-containing protein [Mollisia scopiformis]|uniref:DWNN-domain-containing protein n=1 Tax=Mollisia scopiformis TaxID=149040 RepID=A0A194X6F4_MOLSC|nr:DWNN-domain-containing protein [Mollisia scopiformis]KUJ15755.1 DWNN-domain-containing protein [Mollisia scopiformis]